MSIDGWKELLSKEVAQKVKERSDLESDTLMSARKGLSDGIPLRVPRGRIEAILDGLNDTQIQCPAAAVTRLSILDADRQGVLPEWFCSGSTRPFVICVVPPWDYSHLRAGDRPYPQLVKAK